MATKKLSAAQKLMLEQVTAGPLKYEKLDGYGRRVAGFLEDAGLVKNEGELVEITDAGLARLAKRKAEAKHLAKTNGNGKSPVARAKPATLDARIAALAALDAEYKAKREAVEMAAPYFVRA
jgi:hypothetical protein